MLLYGAGGHAKVIATCLSAAGHQLTALFDDNPLAVTSLQVPLIYGYRAGLQSDKLLIISIGNNLQRKALSKTIWHKFGKIAHPSVLIDDTAEFDDGTVLLHRSVLQAGVRIGKHVIINTCAVIEHDVVISDYSHIAPGAILCGHAKVGESSLIGAGCVITPNITIGSNCLVAAGSVVTTSLPDGAVARGNPARILKIQK
jgi:sugar O-acyltransferase (sialic acid O-acetyltransferase NeuD family)